MSDQDPAGGSGRYPDQHLRLSDAEREQAATDLGEHYAQGRLSVDEHAERLDRVWAARTRSELGPIFSDLPAPRGPYGDPPPAAIPPWQASRGRGPRGVVGASRRRLPGPVFAVLVVLAAIAVVTHLPFILIGLLVWFVLLRPHTRGRCQPGWHGPDHRARA